MKASFLVVALMLPIAGAVICLQGHKLLSVQSASMLPAIHPGDALIVSTSPKSQLQTGDIISYHSPSNPHIIISHRLLSIDKRTGWLTTAGDATHAADPEFPPSLVVGRAVAVAPGFGSVLNAFRRPIGLILAIYMPALLIIAAEVRNLFDAYARPFYSARL